MHGRGSERPSDPDVFRILLCVYHPCRRRLGDVRSEDAGQNGSGDVAQPPALDFRLFTNVESLPNLIDAYVDTPLHYLENTFALNTR